MLIPKAKNLKFESFRDSPPFRCNACGKEITQGFIADVFLSPETSKDTFSFVVCNRTCEKAFKYSPYANKYVRDSINKVKQQAKTKKTINAIFVNFQTQEVEIDLPKMLDGFNLPDTEENREYCIDLAKEMALKVLPNFIIKAMNANNN